MGITRTPGISASFGETAISSSSVVRVRSLHGFTTIPEKPPVGPVIWKMLSASGKDR